ncbi:acyl-CoA N-acyltransferase [Atractiella rhizophila]|nr:acyl-CoA N-acyltransferase [Atractiella rhizophila]
MAHGNEQTSDSYIFKPLPPSFLSRALEIEQASYPASEAGTEVSFTYRLTHAPHLFYACFLPSSSPSSTQPSQSQANPSVTEQEDLREDEGELVGFVCATCSASRLVTEESFTSHSPERGAGHTVCIHSVVVSQSHRSKGLGRILLRRYLSWIREQGYDRVALLAHRPLVGFYESVGFAFVGKSVVEHGMEGKEGEGEPWWDMEMELRGRKTWKELVASGEQGSFDVDVGLEGERNKFDVRCKREGCRSIILKKGTATVVTRPNRTSPESSQTTVLLVPSPLTFENIGFSKDVPLPSSSSSASSSADPTQNKNTLKYLTCADCDHGPLGWCETKGRDVGREVDEEIGGARTRGTAGTGGGVEYLVLVDQVVFWVD